MASRSPLALESGARLTPWSRLALVLVALGIFGGLGLARVLEPDPNGFGTHTQLGLPPCQFQAVTGVGCPSCGMTTAFAWLARGRWGDAWQANPGGCLLAALCVVLVPWLIGSALRGRPWGTRTVDGPLVGVVVATVASSLLAWTVRWIVQGGR